MLVKKAMPISLYTWLTGCEALLLNVINMHALKIDMPVFKCQDIFRIVYVKNITRHKRRHVKKYNVFKAPLR